ncbi:elongation factor P [Pseudoleptotrichia goodfellowii]|uniref:Elongation factor P n=2 Tax=Pseudoleptotrichia goodfellowii TaxID=157692 RepID=D0GJB3_9FUSO|nr:elongation factor P [Pseudoleptotrichia goodfellowii]EEY35857.1 translation elongation factor P [Pseudoleptotrichia goodfellowii F0264]BBM36362.1 translation elongation factor P [Pseudoleptotrichia goodfellowii]
MKAAMDLRQGSTYRKDGVPYLILRADRHQSTSGKKARAAEMKFKIKDLMSGKVQEITVLSTEMMDDIILDRNQMQFLYESEGEYFFMDQESFEQIALTEEDLGDAVNFLVEEMVIQVLMYEGTPVGVELPNTVVREVTYTEPGLKGDTIGRATKPATISTGYTLQVPLFVVIGDKIKIDTRTGEYMERANG